MTTTAIPFLTARRRPAQANWHRALLVARMFASPAGTTLTVPIRVATEYLLTAFGPWLSFEPLAPWAIDMETRLLALGPDDLFPVTLAVVRELLGDAPDACIPLDRALAEAQYAALRLGWPVTDAHTRVARELLAATGTPGDWS